MERRTRRARLSGRRVLPVPGGRIRGDERTVKELQAATLDHFKAKDILRSSRLPLLPEPTTSMSPADIAKVKAGKRLSPVLLVRGSLARGVPMQIADGYHRVCASYHLGENNDIPCRIAQLPAD